LKSELPIGIFDSGIGGLTVAREIIELMPNEKVVYFGDTLHLPYGEKSNTKVINYCSKICEFLMKKKCKAIVVACNTASSVAINSIKKKIGEECYLFNVIDPVIEKIKKFKSTNIGVIGTNATISSKIYEKKIQEIYNDINVFSLATPLLAPMIESRFHDASIKKKIIATYLNNQKLNSIETLILGCTHYPLILSEIQEFYSNKVPIISSLNSIGAHIKEKLEKNKLLSKQKFEKKHEFFVSDITTSFQKNAKSFFTHDISLKENNIFNEK